MNNDVRIVRQGVQAAIEGEAETSRNYYHMRAPKIDRETAEHDRPQYKRFKLPTQELYYCVNCGRMVPEDKAALHDRVHKLGGTMV